MVKRYGSKKLSLRDAQASFMSQAPSGIDPSKLPAFMLKEPPKPRTAPNSKDEKLFVDRLLKLCADYYRTGLKRIWLRKNTQGVFRTMDGRQTVRCGLGVATGDCIGYVVHTVQQSDVGRHVAIFCSIEAKAAGGRATDEQKAFVDQVGHDGGIAMIAVDADGFDPVIRQLDGWSSANTTTPPDELCCSSATPTAD